MRLPRALALLGLLWLAALVSLGAAEEPSVVPSIAVPASSDSPPSSDPTTSPATPGNTAAPVTRFLSKTKKWTDIRTSEKELLDEFDPRHTLTMIVPPNEEICLNQMSDNDYEYMRGAFYVTTGDQDVRFSSTDSYGNVFHESTTSELVFQYSTGDADSFVSFCFSHGEWESVAIAFAVSGQSRVVREIEGAIDPLMKTANEVEQTMNAIHGQQAFVANSFKRYSKILETSLTEISFFSTLNFFVIAFLAVVQVWYIRRLIDQMKQGILGR